MSAIGSRTMASALLDGAADIFERSNRKPEETVRSLHAKLGALAVANDFFVHKAQAMDRQVRRGMIERGNPALSISRSSFCDGLVGKTVQNLGLMQLIDTPCYGIRQMTWHLKNKRHCVNQKRIRRLMRLMPIYQKPNTSKPRKGHKTNPYLLGGLQIDRPGQVWCADLTYLPMRRGFLYLVVITDWFTRKVLAWRISNTLE